MNNENLEIHLLISILNARAEGFNNFAAAIFDLLVQVKEGVE